MTISATTLKGSLVIKREYDIRHDSKLGKATDMEPENCACCDRKIFKVALMENGELLGLECACIMGRSKFAQDEQNVMNMRQGRNLTVRQQAYARERGLL